jgi:AcrR family transcriptional regulator
MARKHRSTIKNAELIKAKERQIAAGAIKIFSKKGFHNTAVREVAESAGLSIGNLYAYIEEKDDILYLVFREIYEKWSPVLLEDSSLLTIQDPEEQLVETFSRMWDAIDELEDLFILAYREMRWLERDHLREILIQESRLVDFVEQIIRRGVEMGRFRNVDSTRTANAIVFLLALVPLRGWNFMKDHYTYETVKKHIIGLILQGILPEKTRGGA